MFILLLFLMHYILPPLIYHVKKKEIQRNISLLLMTFWWLSSHLFSEFILTFNSLSRKFKILRVPVFYLLGEMRSNSWCLILLTIYAFLEVFTMMLAKKKLGNRKIPIKRFLFLTNKLNEKCKIATIMESERNFTSLIQEVRELKLI